MGLFKRRPNPGDEVRARCQDVIFEGVVVTLTPDRTPVIAYVSSTSGEVDELPLLFCKTEVLSPGTIPRNKMRKIMRYMGTPVVEEILGPWQTDADLDERWNLIQVGDAKRLIQQVAAVTRGWAAPPTKSRRWDSAPRT